MKGTSMFKLIIAILTLLGLFKPFQTEAQNYIGLGIAREATHPGSAIDENNILPVVSYNTGMFFVSSVKGVPEFGASWPITENLTVSGIFVIEHERKSSDSNTLTSNELTAKDRSVSFGSLIEYKTTIGPVPLAFLVRLRARNGDHDGFISDQRFTMGVYQNRFMQAQVFGQLTYSDQDAMNADFNLEPSSRAIELDSGFSQVAIGLQSVFVLNDDWSLLLSAERRQLRGDAKTAPITERENVNQVIAGVTFQF